MEHAIKSLLHEKRSRKYCLFDITVVLSSLCSTHPERAVVWYPCWLFLLLVTCINWIVLGPRSYTRWCLDGQKMTTPRKREDTRKTIDVFRIIVSFCFIRDAMEHKNNAEACSVTFLLVRPFLCFLNGIFPCKKHSRERAMMPVNPNRENGQ